MKATLIFNPAAGQREVRDQLRAVVGYLTEHDWQLSWRETTPELDAPEVARRAVAEGAEMVIAAGGDGTINGVINGIMGQDVLLGIIPAGTANLWAQESGISSGTLLGPDFEQAGRVLLEGVPLAVDVGCANGRYFLLVAGIGLDALVTESVDKELKKRTGALAYAWAALREGRRYRGASVRLTLDGVRHDVSAWLVTVSNSKLYAKVPLALNASLTDGLLDIGIFRGRRWYTILAHAIRVALRLHTQAHDIDFLQAREITIESEPPLPVHIDAEPIGQTPVTITVLPRALRVIVPPEVVASLSQGKEAAG